MYLRVCRGAGRSVRRAYARGSLSSQMRGGHGMSACSAVSRASVRGCEHSYGNAKCGDAECDAESDSLTCLSASTSLMDRDEAMWRRMSSGNAARPMAATTAASRRTGARCGCAVCSQGRQASQPQQIFVHMHMHMPVVCYYRLICYYLRGYYRQYRVSECYYERAPWIDKADLARAARGAALPNPSNSGLRLAPFLLDDHVPASTMDPSEHNYSSLSELESLSDSDWLDIASSRASEDNDSLAGFEDSDRDDLDGRPASRHSFASHASERDEPVDAWEGLIDDASDLETPLPLPAEDALTSPFGPQPRSSSPLADDDAEDERVKAGLEQSMMSTLSSSRSNSLANSVQTSMVSSTRALRLSFPDPTTSPIESLNASFEQLTRSDIRAHEPDATAQEHAELSAADPGLQSTPEVPEDKEEQQVYASSFVKPDLSIVLYGSSPLAKHSLVQMLLDKWALSHGLVLTQRIDESARVVSHVYETEEPEHGKPISRRICVMDKTGLEQVCSLIACAVGLTSAQTVASPLSSSSTVVLLLQSFSSLLSLRYPCLSIPFTFPS